MAASAGLRRLFRFFGGVAAALGAAALVHHPAHADVHRAALVIEHASGRLAVRCISFVQDQITGLQLMALSGVAYETEGFGSLGEAVCQLDGEPAMIPAHCFGSGAYWQYFRRENGRWVNSETGVSNRVLRDGDMDGWHYAVGAGQVPPALAFSQVCAPLANQPAPTVHASAVATSYPYPPPSSPATRPAFPSLTPNLPSVTATPAPGPPESASAAETLGVLGGSLLILAALTAWNLWRRGP